MSMEGQYYRDLENFIDVDFDMKGQLKASGELLTFSNNGGIINYDFTQIINPEEIAPVVQKLQSELGFARR